MTQPIQSLIQAGSKVWLDSVHPEAVAQNRTWGVTGATSNPVIISDLIRSGVLDRQLDELLRSGQSDEEVAWTLADRAVRMAQEVFLPVWEQTQGDDGYVSFELDPLLEDPQCPLSHEEKVQRYIALGKQWSSGHRNRMIKVPATPAGIDALEELAAAGVTLNVTLLFVPEQYRRAREAVWRGAQRRGDLEHFKAVFSIFVSRIDVYTAKHVPELSPQAQGQVGIVNAKRIWQENEAYWADKGLKLKPETIFASTGVKNPDDPPDKYVEALAGSDILTNPPQTNAWVQQSGKTYTRQVDRLPRAEVLEEIDRKVDLPRMFEVLMREGLEKFATPQKELLQLVASRRGELERVG